MFAKNSGICKKYIEFLANKYDNLLVYKDMDNGT